jgi:hypothetical protein
MDYNFISDGLIYDELATDYLFGDAITLLEQMGKVNKPNPNYIYSRNQAKDPKTRNFCTAVAPVSNFITYWQTSWTDAQRYDFRDWAKENYGYVSDKGYSKTVGEKCALQYWNAKNADMQMLGFTEKWLSANYWYAMGQGFEACIAYRGNAKWNSDRVDGVLDETTHGDSTYGHIRRDRAMDKSYILAVDNYEGRKIGNKVVNHYLIPRDNLAKLRNKTSKDTGYYPSATFFLPLKAISQIPLDWTKYWLAEITQNSNKRNEVHNDNRLSEATKNDYKAYLHNCNNEIRKKFIVD